MFEGRGEGGVVAHNWCSMTVFSVEKVGGRGRGMDEARDRGLEKVGRRERVNAGVRSWNTVLDNNVI